MSLVVASLSTAVSGGASDAVLTLHVTAELRAPSSHALPDDEFEVAGRTARALLATAGIRSEWRDCRTANPECRESGREGVSVLVRLRPQAKAPGSPVCGEVARDYLGRPVVVAYLAPHVALTTAFRFHVASRSNPSLGGIRTGQLVGLTLAHEVGHWLDLGHAPSGVMKARPGLQEVTDLVAETLAFAPLERSRLRMALRDRSSTVTAAR